MADTPKYVRLADRLKTRTQVDLNSGFTISGLDVKEVPDRKKYPNAHRYIREKLARGVLEPASAAEYEEVQEAFEESKQRFSQRLEDLAALGVNPASMGFAVHQEGAIQQQARDRRAKIEETRSSKSEETSDEDEGDTENETYESWTNADLQNELRNRGLDASGNKAELVERLEEDDEGDEE